MGDRGTVPKPLAECPHEAAYPKGVGHVKECLGFQPGACNAGLVQ